MVNRIEQDTDTVSVQSFKSVLQRPEPLPKDMQHLAAVRNSFAHYKDALVCVGHVKCQDYTAVELGFNLLAGGPNALALLFACFPLRVRLRCWR